MTNSTIELTFEDDASIHQIAETIVSLYLRVNETRGRRGQQCVVPTKLVLDLGQVPLTAEESADLRRSMVTGFTDGPEFLSPMEVRAFFDPAHLPHMGTLFPTTCDQSLVASECARYAAIVIKTRKHCAF